MPTSSAIDSKLSRRINSEILRLSLPAVFSNIALPLLGLCDTFITGHLGAEVFLAAIAVGTMMVNSSYWLFGFLRAGTSGLTAEAVGRRDKDLQRHIFTLSFLIGIAIGLAIILLGGSLCSLLLLLVDAPAETSTLAREYFLISTLSAPALLATMSVSGWMIGKQNTVYPMVIAISVNVINILLSFTFVYGLEAGFKGVAFGTMCANWIGLGIALWLAHRLQGGALFSNPKKIGKYLDIRKFFNVNTNLFFRSGCIMAVTYGMTAYASKVGGNQGLAVNAVVMQLFLFFSFFMDGFAYAAEALCGKWKGAGDKKMLSLNVRWLAAWSVVTSVVFASGYLLFSGLITSWLTDVPEVVRTVNRMRWLCAAIPICSGGAFLLDGVYIGLTQTRRMLLATFTAALAFYAIALIDTLCMPDGAYTILWGAFLTFLLIRSGMLFIWLKSTIIRI